MSQIGGGSKLSFKQDGNQILRSDVRSLRPGSHLVRRITVAF
jgi:hypothetical protein